MHNLKIIISTTRQGRKGNVVASWITSLAKEDKRFDTALLDLAEINLPFMDEPNHPRLQQYQNEHTKKWSTTIQEADAFIIVLSEYNFGFPAPIKNALDYLFNEWKHKPVVERERSVESEKRRAGNRAESETFLRIPTLPLCFSALTFYSLISFIAALSLPWTSST
jgi:NAD(P)H-dependent FMN reductase